jgi:hypothetical protein
VLLRMVARQARPQCEQRLHEATGALPHGLAHPAGNTCGGA